MGVAALPRDVVEDLLTETMLQVSGEMRSVAAAFARIHGVSPRDFDVLVHVDRCTRRGRAVDHGELCRFTGLSPGGVSYVRGRLTEHGLIAGRAVAGDHRRSELECTPAGRQLIGDYQDRVDALVTAVAPGDRASAYRVIDALTRTTERRESA